MKILLACLAVALITIPSTFILATHYFTPQSIQENNEMLEDESQKITFDDDFLKNGTAYVNLLSEEDFSKFNSKVTDLENSEEFSKEIQRLSFNYIIKKDQTLRDLFTKASEELQAKKKNETYFEKSSTCANLTSNIQSNIKKEEGAYATGRTNREFEYMFYSPTLDTCIYTVNKTQYPASSFESTIYKEVYNANSQSIIETYKIYGFNDSESEAESKKSTAEKRLYIKYILENSNYNVDLLRDTDYIYL